MKDSIFEHGMILAWKFMFGVYLFTTALSSELALMGFNIWFLYLGLVGQIISTLVEIQQLTSQKDYVMTFRVNAFISTIVQWIIGPTLALLLTSGFFTTVTPISGALAFGIGAFWELAWKYIKKRTKKTFEDQETDLPDISDAKGEDRPNNGPR